MDYLTVEQVAQMLNVTEKTIRNYISSKELKAFKLGTVWRIKPSDLEAFLQSKSNVQDAQKGEEE